MTDEEFKGELAAILSRLGVKMLRDPRTTRAMAFGEGAQDLALEGIEEAIIGLVLMHINIRRGIS